jgi:hypothetical protein
MDGSYRRMLLVQEMCNSLNTFAKTINGEIKKHEMKGDVYAIPRIRVAVDSLYKVVEDLDKEITVIEKGGE